MLPRLALAFHRETHAGMDGAFRKPESHRNPSDETTVPGFAIL